MDVEKPSHALLQALWDGATDAMALSDEAGIVQAANPAYYRLYGFTPEEVIGQSFVIIFPPEMREWALAQYQAVFHTQTPILPYETVIQRKDGTERLVEAHAMFITSDGVHTGMLSIVRDITDRRRHDVERHRLAAIVEQAPDMIALATGYGQPIYLNRAGQQQLGRPAVDAAAHASILDYFRPEDRLLLQREVLPAVRARGSWFGEVGLLHSTSGATTPVALEVFGVELGQIGHPAHIATIAHRLGEQRRAG